MSLGATVLPTDLDILRPSPSTTKPCVNTELYGALPVVATAVNKEELNQPRCWSEPSRYIAHGTSKPLTSSTPDQEEPESNHTSMISVSFLNSS